MNNIGKINFFLQELGLEQKEINIYFTCLKLGTTVSSNIGKILGIPKSTARYGLDLLVKKGLIIKTQKGNTTFFTPEHPQKLKNLLIIEKNKIEEKEDILNFIMGDLISLYNPNTKIPKITFYEGIEGIKKVLDLSLEAKSTIDSYVDIEAIKGIFDKFNKEYVEKRKKLKIKKRSIYPENSENKKYLKNFYDEINNDLNEVKFLDKQKYNLFKSYVVFMIYDDKVSFLTLEKGNYIGIIIENKAIYTFHKNMFDFMWNNI